MKSLSFSASNTYNECPKKYFFERIRKLKPNWKSSPLVFGNAIDEAFNDVLEGKNGLKKFYDEWDKLQHERVAYSNNDLQVWLLNDGTTERDIIAKKKKDPFDPDVQSAGWETLRAKGPIMIRAFEEDTLPRIKNVIKVQEWIQVKNDRGKIFRGVADFLAEMKDGERVLVDNKTSSVKYLPQSVWESEQLATYFAVLKEKYSLTKAAFNVINKKVLKTEKVNTQYIQDNVNEALIQETFENYDRTLALIEDGEFPRNWSACKGKYGQCVYTNYCHNGDYSGLEE